MRPPRTTVTAGKANPLIWDLLTLDRLLTAPVAHLVYWCGLGLITFSGFASIGVAVGILVREGLAGLLAAFTTIVAGLLVMALLGLLWRSFCELYVVLIRVGHDINALRKIAEEQGVLPHESER